MLDSLAALHAAVVAAPADRTVRLVYADALDECDDPAAAARAAFIRAHVELETTPDADPHRATLAAGCADAFAKHWLDWWRPVCAAMGLPEPYQPRRHRVKATARRPAVAAGAPYAAHPAAWSVRSDEHGFTAQFIAGFPELLFFHHFPPAALAEQLGAWFAAAPFARLRFAEAVSEEEWESIDGPHLAKLTDLTFDRLGVECAERVARSPHLASLTALDVLPVDPNAAVVRALCLRPTWAGLRSLTFAGITPPDALQMFADRCKLKHLESLTFGMCELAERPDIGGMSGALGLMLSEMFTRLFAAQPRPPGPVRWPDYWPPLLVLARSRLFRRLRTLRILDVNPRATVFDNVFRAFDGPAPEPSPDGVFPDRLVRALADGLNADRLERLELPAARLSPAGRADLTRRFGPRVVLT